MATVIVKLSIALVIESSQSKDLEEVTPLVMIKWRERMMKMIIPFLIANDVT